jgi:hypothetical protein
MWCDLLMVLLGTVIKSGLLGRLLRMRCSRSRRLLWSTTLVPRRWDIDTSGTGSVRVELTGRLDKSR